jgi:predicted GH43/DUF377 family glycosyl hydrolase
VIRRLFNACLCRPGDLRPSRDDLEIVGTFNPGAIAFGDEVIILVRVAERPRERRAGHTALPRWQSGAGLSQPTIIRLRRSATPVSTGRQRRQLRRPSGTRHMTSRLRPYRHRHSPAGMS